LELPQVSTEGTPQKKIDRMRAQAEEEKDIVGRAYILGALERAERGESDLGRFDTVCPHGGIGRIGCGRTDCKISDTDILNALGLSSLKKNIRTHPTRRMD